MKETKIRTLNRRQFIKGSVIGLACLPSFNVLSSKKK